MTIPQHIAIIMDGNRRWASRRGLPLAEGYRRGIEAFRQSIPAVVARRIPVATFWGFSTENWRRTPGELETLFSLFRRAVDEAVEWFNRHNARLVLSGRIQDFPEHIRAGVERLAEATRANTAAVINLALSYGGREDILQATRRIAAEFHGSREPDAAMHAINEETFSQYLYTSGLPDVDLLIRTSGERRLSGFLPWQAAYAELYFTDTLWPDFDEAELDRALADFAERKRNFGT